MHAPHVAPGTSGALRDRAAGDSSTEVINIPDAVASHVVTEKGSSGGGAATVGVAAASADPSSAVAGSTETLGTKTVSDETVGAKSVTTETLGMATTDAVTTVGSSVAGGTHVQGAIPSAVHPHMLLEVSGGEVDKMGWVHQA